MSTASDTYFRLERAMNGKSGMKNGRKVAHKTYVYVRDTEAGKVYELHLFGNKIIEASITETKLYSQGWHTKTTKARLNRFGPICVHQVKGEWYLVDGRTFYEGITV